MNHRRTRPTTHALGCHCCDCDNDYITPSLIGGPLDGYDGISVRRQDATISVSGHHLRDTGCPRSPVYNKFADRKYRFVGYADEQIREHAG